MRWLLVASFLFIGCATHHVAATPAAPQTPHVWIPSGVPDSVVICVAIQQQQRWICTSVGELRQLLATQAKV